MSKTRILSFVAFYLLVATLAIAYVYVHFCRSNANNIIAAITALTLLLATAQSGDRLAERQGGFCPQIPWSHPGPKPAMAAEAGTEEHLQLAWICSYL